MARYEFATHRLFVEAPLAAGIAVPLGPAAINYLLHALRMPDGARLLAFNGRDGEWEARLDLSRRKSPALVPVASTRAQPLPSPLVLAFAPLKSARLEYAIQKAVEMGAGTLQPILTERTQTRGLRADKLRAYAIEAAEQCGVLALPVIAAEAPLETFLATLRPEDLRIVADEEAPVADPVAALRAAAPGTRPVVFIGPEGGFTEAERTRLLAETPLVRLSLGPRILRGDTAAVAALALVQAVLGDGVARKDS